jgi:hypothetical protein
MNEKPELIELKPDREGFPGWYGKGFYFIENDVLSLFQGIGKLIAWRNELLSKQLDLEIDLNTEHFCLREKSWIQNFLGEETGAEGYGTIGLKFELKIAP